MQKQTINIRNFSKMIVLLGLTINLACAQKAVHMTLEEGSASKPFLKTKYELTFQQFFHDSVQVFIGEKRIFSEYIETNPKYGASPKSCIIEKEIIMKENNIILKISGELFKMKIEKNYSFYYFNYFKDELYAQYTNDERNFN